ncbi:MAG TPA: TIGR03087 family PEP-CTERM/XrtA system glycosyltransferase [Allosphingosinicella sp.]|nr:TIGR03087 family PEP-CTERM/XrtA system glycosyltransferase [Allosphingosinicella sp.]
MKPELLFLAHRIPYPPDRGDKIRSWHILRHLADYATVHLACFADDAADAAHLPALREALDGRLGEAFVATVSPSKLLWMAKAYSRRLTINEAAMSSAGLRDFVTRILAARPIAGVYAFSVQMARFVPAGFQRPFVMDFVDFDSAKYADYARKSGLAGRLVYDREAKKMFALEKATAARADVGLFVSEAEAALFRAEAKLPGADIRALSNGIDLVFFAPDAGFVPLPAQAGPRIVFTGQMNYRPNVEAVTDFAEQVFPRLRAARPELDFAIVGRRPPAAVEALAARPGITVTGDVPDVRPWLASADIVVAPLQIARGIQNKVLEAMAMGRAVVASPGAYEGIDALPGRDLMVAADPAAQADAILSLLDAPERAVAMGKAARARMVSHYGWEAQLAPLAAMLGLEVRKEAA